MARPWTYFEHGTLAALAIFEQTAPRRRDRSPRSAGRAPGCRTRFRDADCAIVTSVAADHGVSGDDSREIGFVESQDLSAWPAGDHR